MLHQLHPLCYACTGEPSLSRLWLFPTARCNGGLLQSKSVTANLVVLDRYQKLTLTKNSAWTQHLRVFQSCKPGPIRALLHALALTLLLPTLSPILHQQYASMATSSVIIRALRPIIIGALLSAKPSLFLLGYSR